MWSAAVVLTGFANGMVLPTNWVTLTFHSKKRVKKKSEKGKRFGRVRVYSGRNTKCCASTLLSALRQSIFLSMLFFFVFFFFECSLSFVRKLLLPLLFVVVYSFVCCCCFFMIAVPFRFVRFMESDSIIRHV